MILPGVALMSLTWLEWVIMVDFVVVPTVASRIDFDCNNVRIWARYVENRCKCPVSGGLFVLGPPGNAVYV